MLKILTYNLKCSNRLCRALYVASNGVNLSARSRLLQITQTSHRCSTLKYSTGKTDSTGSKIKISRNSASSQNEHLTPDEIHMLKQDPDNFGTLSSHKLLPADEIQNEETLNESITQSNEPTGKKNSSKKKNASEQKSIEHYEQQLKDLIGKGDVRRAVEYFESEMLLKDHVLAPIHIYEWLITECINSHEVHKAFDIYDHMINRQLNISVDIVEKLLLAFELTNLSSKKVYSLEKIISKNQYEMNEKMYNALVRAHGRSPQWQNALPLADEMKKRGIKYEIETINTLFNLCSYDKENGFNRLIELWHEMQKCEIIPDVHTFNAFLKAVQKCESQNVDKLKKTVELLAAKSTAQSNGINDGRPNLLADPPNIGYLFPLENVKEPEDRLLILGGLTGLLKLFKKYDILPTTETIITLLHIAPNTTEAHQRVTSLLKKNDVAPDANLFHVLLTKNCIKPRFQNAKEIIDLMYATNVEVDLVSHGLFAMSCTNQAEAEEFFEELDSQNMHLDADIINAMLKNACTLKNNDFIICILRKMQTAQIEPTEEHFQMVRNYNQNVFRNLRTEQFASKKMRNDSFKFSREYKRWMKHFRNDQPKVSDEKIKMKSET